MSIAIVGGNHCMVQRYKELCKEHKCKAKVFTQPKGIKSQIGNPDLVVLFTSTVSHKMIRTALAAVSDNETTIVRAHTSSLNALKGILEEYAV